MTAVIAVAFTLIAARLLWVQGLHSSRYVALANSQEVRQVTLPALRGAIFDRGGEALALTELRRRVVADPYQVRDPAAEAAALAKVLPVSVGKLTSDLSEHSGYVVLATNQPVKVGDAVVAAGLAGIIVQQTPVRLHPAGSLADPLVGTVNTAGAGSAGLEYAYNHLLTGTAGSLTERVGPLGEPVPGGILRRRPAIPGDDLVLSIDGPLQFQAEQVVAHAIVAAKASSGEALIMDTRTGDLLAVAEEHAGGGSTSGGAPVSVTGSNGQGPVEADRATAFTDAFAPGSLEKVVTVSGALAQGAITPGQSFVIPNGYPVAGTVFHDAERHPTERLSVTGILAQSSNIGAIQIAQHLGATAFYRYLSAFGETAPTAVHFPGESAGLRPALGHLSGTSLATMAFGQGISVTAAQMVAAVNTVADGGIYVPPRLVDATIGPHGHRHDLPTVAPHRAVSATVASQVTAMLEQVVSAGTGTAAKVAGYAVAGKTGTANVAAPGGGFEVGKVTASFAGFAPAQHPAVTVLVVMHGTDKYGAQAAAPAFSTLTGDALRALGVPSAGRQPPPAATAAPQPAG